MRWYIHGGLPKWLELSSTVLEVMVSSPLFRTLLDFIFYNMHKSICVYFNDLYTFNFNVWYVLEGLVERYSVPVRCRRSWYRSPNTAKLFFNFSFRHSHFLSFWHLFFQFRNQQEKWGQPTLFIFLQIIILKYSMLGLNHYLY